MIANYPGPLERLGCGLGVCRAKSVGLGLRAALALDGVSGSCPEFLLLLEPLSWRDLVQWNGRKLAPVHNIQGRVIKRQIAVQGPVNYGPETMAGG